jgi:hypothetical protein
MALIVCARPTDLTVCCAPKMGRIRKGRVGMPKIKKTKVAPSRKHEKATVKAKKMPAKPPPPGSPAKPTPRTPAAASPGRKQLTDAKNGLKEAKRQYLMLARDAKKAEKARDRRKELLDKQAATAARALKLPKSKAPRMNLLALSNSESRWLTALAEAYCKRLAAATVWDGVRAYQLALKDVEMRRLRYRLWRARVVRI